MSETNDTIAGDMQWNQSTELMLARWCDQSKCFEWMHTEAYGYFEKRDRIVTISSNILTAVSGLSNVIAGGASFGAFQLSWVFGALSITVSISNMLQEKLAYGSRAIAHRQYSILWGIIRRKIEEEVSIPPESRKDCATFLKCIRQDINQVSMDGNAKIPEHIKTACNDKFSKIPDFDVPDICGDMEHTQIYVKDPSQKLLSSGQPTI